MFCLQFRNLKDLQDQSQFAANAGDNFRKKITNTAQKNNTTQKSFQGFSPLLASVCFVQLRGFMAVLIQTHHPGTEEELKSGRGGEELGGQMAGNIKLQKTSKERA